MTWARIALLHAAGESDTALDKVADVFGYVSEKTKIEGKEKAPTIVTTIEVPEDDDRVQATAMVSRPPARFLRIVHRRDKGVPNTERPAFLDDPQLAQLSDGTSQGGTWFFDPPEPLLRFSRLAPLLFNGLGKARSTAQVDVRQLTRRLALGQASHRPPCLRRQRWPQRLQIIVDTSPRLEPYRGDFRRIVERLESLLGGEAVEAIGMDEAQLAEQQPLVYRWPGQPTDHGRYWHPPPPDTAILLLSDFGEYSDRYRPAVLWQRFGSRLAAQAGVRLSLSTAACSPDAGTGWLQRLRPVALNDQHPPRRSPGRQGFVLPADESELPTDHILALLSALPLIDAGLLRRLRLALNWGGSEREGELWNHPAMQVIAPFGIRLHPEQGKGYRDTYQQRWADSPEAKTLWKEVQQHHNNAYLGLRRQELLQQNLLSAQPIPDDLRNYLRRLAALTAQGKAKPLQQDALRHMLRSLLSGLPSSVWQSDCQEEAYALFALAWEEELRRGEWPQQLDETFDPDRLVWMTRGDSPISTETWRIVQTAGQGQCRIEPEAAALPVAQPIARFLVSRNTPVMLNGPTGNRQAFRQAFDIALSPGQRLRLESDRVELELEAEAKPSWASRIWQEETGLVAWILLGGIEYVARWRSDTNGGRWGWRVPDQFGFDDYGIYADIEFKGITQRFRWIAPGTFMMGSPEDEPGRHENEKLHDVTLPQGFWLADTTVTQALYQTITGNNPAHFNDNPDNPVEQVSWKDAVQFVQRLNFEVHGLDARLPTEAEWEYACRAGTQTPFSFGKNITPNQVNYDGDRPYVGGEKGLNRKRTVPVKSLPANPWGLYEMHGNIGEWCHDNLEVALMKKPQGSKSHKRKVVRGSSWLHAGEDVRSAFRDALDFSHRIPTLGFRLALGGNAIKLSAKPLIYIARL